ncbi:hypothetical protein AX774_g6626, partial [Zancudomyces culisetae]
MPQLPKSFNFPDRRNIQAIPHFSYFDFLYRNLPSRFVIMPLYFYVSVHMHK